MMRKRKVYCAFLLMGKRKVFNCIYCARPVTGRHHTIASKNEYTHDGKAGLSLLWAHMGFFCLIGAFIFHFNEPRLEKTVQLGSYIVQFLYFLNLILHGSSRLLRLCNTIFDGPGRNPKADRFSQCVAKALKITKCKSVCSFLTLVT